MSGTDTIGKRFTRLVVIRLDGYQLIGKAKKPSQKVFCQCDCGNTVSVLVRSLARDNTRSCGCLNRDVTRNLRFKHGAQSGRRKTPEYNSWAQMKARCLNLNYTDYKNYGGRGIRICSGLLEFADFLKVLNNRPSGKTLDRQDNSAHYSCGVCEECNQNGWPMNCRWATRLEQNSNTRVNRNLTYNGRTMHIAAWSREVGIDVGTLRRRLARGWSTSLAFETKPDAWASRRLLSK